MPTHRDGDLTLPGELRRQLAKAALAVEQLRLRTRAMQKRLEQAETDLKMAKNHMRLLIDVATQPEPVRSTPVDASSPDPLDRIS